MDFFAAIDQMDAVHCLDAKINDYHKDDILLMAGEKITHIGLILSGTIRIEKTDIDGNRIIIAQLAAGELFAETLAAAAVDASPVTAIASDDVRVMWVAYCRILAPCQNACLAHTALIESLLKLLAQKNLFLQSRLELLSLRTLRERIMHYLRSLPMQKGSIITVPFSREMMADYLLADRTALSHELSRMKKDHLIDYHKNHFKLL